jgi:glucose/mannose transport system substrate-binding protein
MARHRILFLVAAANLLVHQASAQDAQVMHWWTSGGESRAVSVFAKEYEKRGGKWIDGASVGPQAEHAAVLNAIAGGNPPAAFQWNIGVAVRQLAEQGLLANLDDMASAGDWKRHLPPLLVKNITVDGHVIAVPVNLHGANWMFYSTKVFSALNMAPPKTWDEFLAEADKIKAAGYLPIAMGGNAQQTGWLFYAILAGVGGKEAYRKVFVAHDGQAAGSDEVRRAFETMGKIRQYADAGGTNRKWNDTLALVETNKAAFMIAGDWAKGDFSAAGMTVGKEYGCLPAPGTQDAYVMTVDVFAFPKVTKPDQIAAQRKLAELMMDPAVQVEFNKFKGSLPARLDADVGSLDACAQLGQKVMAGGEANQLPNFALAFGPDTQGQIEDLLIHYWSTPGMSAVDATKEFSTIIANAGS